MSADPLRKSVASPDSTPVINRQSFSDADQQPGRSRIKELEVMVAEVIRETPEVATLVLFTGNDRPAFTVLRATRLRCSHPGPGCCAESIRASRYPVPVAPMTWPCCRRLPTHKYWRRSLITCTMEAARRHSGGACPLRHDYMEIQ